MTADAAPSTEMIVDPRFLQVADRFFRMFRTRQQGGGALAAYLHGEPVLDIWAGWATRDRRWAHDTVPCPSRPARVWRAPCCTGSRSAAS